MTLGQVIKYFIKKRELKQKDVAETAGISTTALSLIINDKSYPTKDNIEAICKAINVPEVLLHFHCITEESAPKHNKQLFNRFTVPMLKNYIKEVWGVSEEDLIIN